MLTIGNTGNGTKEFKYVLLEKSNNGRPFELMTNKNGEAWVIIGTDSGFESTSTQKKVNAVPESDSESSESPSGFLWEPPIFYVEDLLFCGNQLSLFKEKLKKPPKEISVLFCEQKFFYDLRIPKIRRPLRSGQNARPAE